MTEPTELYRYEDRVYSTCSISPSGHETYSTTPVQLHLHTYPILATTAKGFWISYGFSRKWVPRTAHAPFAFQSKLQALDSFRRRKNRQIQILSARLSRAHEALALANREELSWKPQQPE